MSVFNMTSSDELIKLISKKTEKIMMEQLNELVGRGILVWEETQPVISRDEYTDELVITKLGRLVLSNQEYVEKIEKENEELKTIISTFKNSLEKINE